MDVKKFGVGVGEYFQVVQDGSTWWTATMSDTGWHIVTGNGERQLISGGHTWKRVARAVEKYLEKSN